MGFTAHQQQFRTSVVNSAFYGQFFYSQISDYHYCIPVNIFASHFVPNRLPEKDITN